MSGEIVIPGRFCGPPRSANGGYACGVIAAGLDSPGAVVTLRHPPPLDTPMRLEPDGNGVALRCGERLIGEGAAAELELELIEPAGLDEAADATARYLGHRSHLFPGCFVCGPARDDGLRLFPGRLADREAVAAPWAAGRDATLEVVWAALDCPSYFGAMEHLGESRAALLGRLTGAVWRRPEPGEPCVVMGWYLGAERRKIRCASAVFSGDGEALAAASALWIEVAELPS